MSEPEAYNADSNKTLNTDFVFASISLPEKLEYITNKYAEHSHDKWSSEKVGPTLSFHSFFLNSVSLKVLAIFHLKSTAFSMANGEMLLQVSAGWKHGDCVNEHTKSHPLLKPYKALTEKVLHKLLLFIFSHHFVCNGLEKSEERNQ